MFFVSYLALLFESTICMAFNKKKICSQMVSRPTSEFRFSFLPCRWRQHSAETPIPIEAALSRFEPENSLPWDVPGLFKTHINFFTVCFGKSTFALLTLLTPALGSPLSNCFYWCVGIVLQNWYQVANRVTDVCGESIIHGNTSEMSTQRAGRVRVCALVNINP
jgi:hypothetical protein